MKKIISFFCVLLLGLCLVSCKDEPPVDDPNQGNTEPPSGDKLPDDGEYTGTKKIVFWHNMNLGRDIQELLQEAIQKFEQNNDGWKIDLVYFNNLEEILEKTLKETDQPDYLVSEKPDLVFSTLEHTARYKEKDIIVDMNVFIKDSEIGLSNEKINDFIKPFYEEGMAFGDGGMYCLPFAKAADVLYYYQNDGASSYPKTWEEYDRLDQYQDSLLEVESEGRLFSNLARQSGAKYTSLDQEHYVFDNEKNRSNVEMLKRWYDQGKLFTWQNSTKPTKNSQYIIASSGAFDFYRYTTASIGQLMAAPIPTFQGKKRQVTFYGPSLCMLKQHSVKMKQTWKFIKDYLLDAKFQAEYSMRVRALYNPVLKSSYELDAYKEWYKEDELLSNVIQICKQYLNEYIYNPPFVGSDNALIETGRIIINVLDDKKTIDEAFQDALKNCKAYK